MQQPIEAHLTIACRDLDRAIDHFTRILGFRLDMIMPADAPRIAQISGHGLILRLEITSDDNRRRSPVRLRLPARFATSPEITPEVGIDAMSVCFDKPPAAMPAPSSEMLITRAGEDYTWQIGRAGMHYRDLVPGRLGGRVIASHIRITKGGEVPDYVHYHEVAFQMIDCRRGRVRVVYEDQGEDFVLREGDCVLQPPRIRHRVLESSPGLEVIEIGCPAEHETWRDHDLPLPTTRILPDRDFAGQRFIRHVASDAQWTPSTGSFEFRDTGITGATGGIAGARVLRGHKSGRVTRRSRRGETLLICLKGTFTLCAGNTAAQSVHTDDVCVVPPESEYEIAHDTAGKLEVLEVELPVDVTIPATNA